MDREELLRKYAGGEKDFTGRRFGGDWRDKLFRGGIYREADFSNAYFDSSGFLEVDLSFANFRRIHIYESSFQDSYMEGLTSVMLFSDRLVSKMSILVELSLKMLFSAKPVSKMLTSVMSILGELKDSMKLVLRGLLSFMKRSCPMEVSVLIVKSLLKRLASELAKSEAVKPLASIQSKISS